MAFDLAAFRIKRFDGGPSWEADLPAILHTYQDEYFSDVKSPIVVAEFVPSIEEGSPACVRPHVKKIEVLGSLRNFPKLCCFLVLHELINNKLFWQYGKEQEYSSPEFKRAVEEMWAAGAYEGLL